MSQASNVRIYVRPKSYDALIQHCSTCKGISQYLIASEALEIGLKELKRQSDRLERVRNGN